MMWLVKLLSPYYWAIAIYEEFKKLPDIGENRVDVREPGTVYDPDEEGPLRFRSGNNYPPETAPPRPIPSEATVRDIMISHGITSAGAPLRRIQEAQIAERQRTLNFRVDNLVDDEEEMPPAPDPLPCDLYEI